MASTQYAPQSQYAPPDGFEGYVPYAQQAPQEIPFNAKWHRAKIVIRGFNIAFSAIVLGISLSLIFYSFSSSFYLVFSGFPAAALVCWETSELITICARGGRRGIHPGAHVGMHLLFWLVFMVATGWEVANIILRDGPRSWVLSGGQVTSMQDAVMAFTALLFIDNFTLFVRACIECKQRNARPPPVYMVPINGPPPMQPAGSYQPYPYSPQQSSFQPQHDKGQMSGANVDTTERVAETGPDGTYYGPGSRA
ncbi:hypothetical protein CCUS01_14622 [Colletotrichum cuscutae]|uniref:Uncharacterized protein n=1 Tax=Colletotrichum cuscutae TaxID=1209917 RepID=A0AAI9Y8D0_9PEZI|nr:hypothetical protein CCUS01_14622 [Colletotrichum cuscutae]